MLRAAAAKGGSRPLRTASRSSSGSGSSCRPPTVGRSGGHARLRAAAGDVIRAAVAPQPRGTTTSSSGNNSTSTAITSTSSGGGGVRAGSRCACSSRAVTAAAMPRGAATLHQGSRPPPRVPRRVAALRAQPDDEVGRVGADDPDGSGGGGVGGHVASSAFGAAAGTAAVLAAMSRGAAAAALRCCSAGTAAVAAGALGGAVVGELLLGRARVEDVETDADVERGMDEAAERVIEKLREAKAAGGFRRGHRHRREPEEGPREAAAAVMPEEEGL